VQALQQMRADIQVAAPALDAAMVEMRLHVLGVGANMLAHECEHLLGARRLPRMQQGQGLARQEPVVDEEGLFDRQTRVAALQLAGAIALRRAARGSDPARERAPASGRPGQSPGAQWPAAGWWP